MKTRPVAFLLIPVLLTLALLAPAMFSTRAQPNEDCEAFVSGGIPNMTSTDITFTCAEDNIAYFGVCDSGGVPDDDLFVIEFQGSVVSANRFQSGAEFVTIGSGPAAAGNNSAILKSINPGREAPATFSYAISTNRDRVMGNLRDYCGGDFAGSAPVSSCIYGPRHVPVFTQDVAPSNGVLEFRVMLGNESSREGSGLMKSWNVVAGQRLNNEYVYDPLNPRWARLYWKPDHEETWYLLPSQYWFGDGTIKSEYGIECDNSEDQPSYHTAFASAIPLSQVCFNILAGCN